MLDSLGVGEQPDAEDFGQSGYNTIYTVANRVSGISLPNFQALGLGNLTEIFGVPPNPAAKSAFGKMQEQSAGNDTFAGIWEMMGFPFKKRFITYEHGLPPFLLGFVEDLIGCKMLGNHYGSGWEQIQLLADEQKMTGLPILYTSNDGVVQIAANEDVISPEALCHADARTVKSLKSTPSGQTKSSLSNCHENKG